MIEDTNICPYTGLRSFTEEESLYFKGRDAQIDQISKLLERNKFLMVTGASGEGKSSLIFAGLIPNARAGFFRARYNNWVVADFRPERNPVGNMAAALAKATAGQTTTTETELRRGFASLVDLYTNSELFIDEQDNAWVDLPEEGKKSRKRNAANLLILVDQFEEFFTNPENFHHGAPSQDSQVVVNVLLETARIALNENLPIYVVCTMRSDYIGQCSAFRDLPEYIGFSQFFVPRLKRKELKQIIEEPAVLSGNRISQRLVERLVYDLAEGVDQLPILQHALSQIWLAAEHGSEEMDLIHYAKVGGMKSDELPNEDRKLFDSWLSLLPAYQRNFYNETGLERVIELHANRLYEGAWDYYNKAHPASPITQRDAKNIIALTFACLTKIDNSRAVRNRMTLREITHILHRPGLGIEVVGEVLNLFREENNSFIRPFKTADPASRVLAPDSVLDITHESLIRNWGRLNKWAAQEYEFYSTFLDLKKQLGRWLENGKSRDYLLPIGPLSFFESWYARCKPNADWIERYAETTIDGTSSQKSQRLLLDIREFLRKSARKVIITRTFMKYGANRIAAVTAILLMVVMSGFYWFDADRKKNSRVIERVRSTARRLLESKDVDNGRKAIYLIAEERYEPGKLMDFISHMKDPKARINLSIATFQELTQISHHMNRPVKTDLIQFIDHDLESLSTGDLDFAFEKRNIFVFMLACDEYYNASPQLQMLVLKNATALHDLIKKTVEKKDSYKPGLSIRLNQAIHLWLTFGHPTQNEILEIIADISPFQSTQAQMAFDVYYPKGSYEPNFEFEVDFGGGYHTLASLYAAVGDAKSVTMCFEKLNAAPNYFTGKYVFNNYPNVLGYFYSYSHQDHIGPTVQWIVDRAGLTEDEVYTGLINQTGYLKFLSKVNVYPDLSRAYRGNFYPNLNFLDDAVLNGMWSDMEKSISKIKNPSEKAFKFAMAFKQRAVIRHKYNFDRGIPNDDRQFKEWLDRSWKSFESVSEDYLNGKIIVPYRYWLDGLRTKEFARKNYYLYPDFTGGWVNNTYHSDLFFNYLIGKKEFSIRYSSIETLKLIHYWIATGFEVFPTGLGQSLKNDYPLPDSTIERALKLVEGHPQKNSFDNNLLLIVLANRAYQRGDQQAGLGYFSKIKQDNIYTSANTYEYINKTFFYNQLKDLSLNLIKTGRLKDALAIAEKFEKPYQVIFSYIFNAQSVYKNNYDPQTFMLLDSVMTKMKKIELSKLGFNQDFRFQLLHTLGQIGGEEIERGAFKILKEMDESAKVGGTLMWIWGQAQQGNYYKARVAIPAAFTESQDLFAEAMILTSASAEKEAKEGSSGWKESEKYLAYEVKYIFYEPF